MPLYIRDKDAGLWIALRRCRYTKKGVLRRPLKLPIAPLDEFGWDSTYGWTDYDTISQGQYSRPAGRQLRTMNVSTLALDYIAPWSVTQVAETPPAQPPDDSYEDQDIIDEDSWGDPTEIGPWGIARQLDKLVHQGTPIRLIVKNPALPKADVNMIVTVRSANLRERAGEPDARYFDLSFTEYRVPKVARRGYGEHPLPATVQINEQGVGLEFKRGDRKFKKKEWHKIGTPRRPATLRDLSVHFYGTSKKWRKIKMRNRGMLEGFSGSSTLKEVYDKRKRKNRPLRMRIPEADWYPGKGSGKPGKDGGFRP